MLADPTKMMLILGGGSLVLLSNRARPDLVALLVMLSLALSGLITAREALAGFSEPTVMALAGLFVITRALDANGIVHWASGRLEALARGSEVRLVGLFFAAGAALSMVMNNVAAGSVLLPAALSACKKARVSPARVLMPLSAGILLGGMATLFTTANLVVTGVLHSYGQESLTMLDFLYWGGALLIAGGCYTIAWGRHLLPSRELGPSQVQPSLLETYDVPGHLYEVRILPASTLAGLSLAQSNIGDRFGVSVLGLLRGQKAVFDPDGDQLFEEGDVLLVLGMLERIRDMESWGVQVGRRATGSLPVELVEVVVTPRSRAIGQDLVRFRMRARYGVTVVGLWRRGKSYLTDVSRFRLEAGDALLLVGSPEHLQSLAESGDFLLPHATPSPPPSTSRALLTLTVAGISMSLAAQGLLPLALSMLFGAALLVACGCLSAEDAYHGVEWNIIVLIAAMVPVGTALQRSGLAEQVAASLTSLLAYGPNAYALANYLCAMLLTQVMGGQVASLVLGPLAVASAIHLQTQGVSPQVVAVMVALGCSTAFLTPMAHPVNVLMMSPASYRGRDFLRFGVPLTALCTTLVAILLAVTPR